MIHQEGVGIISPPTMPWLGTSLHNLVVLKLKDDSVNLLNLLPVAVEVKCKTNRDTICNKERALMRSGNIWCFERVILRRGMSTLQSEIERFRTLVPDANHRTQCMHHVTTAELGYLLYVILDDVGNIMRVVFVEVDDNYVKQYRHMLSCLYGAHLRVFYEGSSEEIQDTLIDLERKHQDDFRHAADGFALFHRLCLKFDKGRGLLRA